MKNILIVDDSELIRNFHSYKLRSAGFNVFSAGDGYDALEQIYSKRVDLIITDINMPKMDGYILIEKIRSDAQFEDTPIVIVSTEEEMEDKQKGFDIGANAYIVKPTQPDVLIENIKMLLSY
jgi:two-component system, chemotaxis family, chemotaxis protein CheY